MQNIIIRTCNQYESSYKINILFLYHISEIQGVFYTPRASQFELATLQLLSGRAGPASVAWDITERASTVFRVQLLPRVLHGCGGVPSGDVNAWLSL